MPDTRPDHDDVRHHNSPVEHASYVFSFDAGTGVPRDTAGQDAETGEEAFVTDWALPRPPAETTFRIERKCGKSSPRPSYSTQTREASPGAGPSPSPAFFPVTSQNRSENMERTPFTTDTANSPSQPPTHSAADLADELVELFGRRDLAMTAVVQARLRLLEAMIESNLTCNAEEMLYLRNRLASSRALTAAEEWGTALYEMRELARKLRRRENGDEGGRTTFVPDPDPASPAAAAAELVREEAMPVSPRKAAMPLLYLRPHLARRLAWEVEAVRACFGRRVRLVFDHHGRPGWQGTVPVEGRPFPVVVTYPQAYPAEPPRLETTLPLPPRCPHVLGDEAGRALLCWIDPRARQGRRRWDPQRHTAATVLRAAQRWGLALLVWQALGVWPVADALEVRR
jgi:hypothetical protein